MLLETQYWPSIVYFAQLSRAPLVLIEACENYQKRSLRNRVYLMSANGCRFLSIPLAKGKNQQMPIRDVIISYEENWIKNHLFFFKSSYGSTPYFPFYIEEIEELYHRKCLGLFNLNLAILKWILKTIQWEEKEIKLTTKYTPCNQSLQSDFRNKTKSLIKQFENDQNIPRYAQAFEDRYGFVFGLSILDAIFCLGPSTGTYLRTLHEYIEMEA